MNSNQFLTSTAEAAALFAHTKRVLEKVQQEKR